MLTALAVLVVQTAPALPSPSAVEAARLVKQLGSDDYVVREAATKSLESLGKLALPTLRSAAKSADPEIRQRASKLADKLERAALNGEWEAVACEASGRAVSPKSFRWRARFRDGRLAWEMACLDPRDCGDKMAFVVHFHSAVKEWDCGVTAKTIDLATPPEREVKCEMTGGLMTLLYERSGDTLRLATRFSDGDGVRGGGPTSFETRAGEAQITLTFRRVKP